MKILLIASLILFFISFFNKDLKKILYAGVRFWVTGLSYLSLINIIFLLLANLFFKTKNIPEFLFLRDFLSSKEIILLLGMTPILFFRYYANYFSLIFLMLITFKYYFVGNFLDNSFGFLNLFSSLLVLTLIGDVRLGMGLRELSRKRKTLITYLSYLAMSSLFLILFNLENFQFWVDGIFSSYHLPKNMVWFILSFLVSGWVLISLGITTVLFLFFLTLPTLVMLSFFIRPTFFILCAFLIFAVLLSLVQSERRT